MEKGGIMKSRLVSALLTIGIVFLIASSASAARVGGPHLWLGSSSASYVGFDSDPWLSESWVITDNPFQLEIFNASKRYTATDLSLMVAVHAGETGAVTVDGGAPITAFTNTAFPGTTMYGGGNHGVYAPHDGQYAIVGLGFDIAPMTWGPAITIGWEGFSRVHFDVFSSNGFWNPPSHDATAVPEPTTMLLLGTGLVGLVGLKRRKIVK